MAKQGLNKIWIFKDQIGLKLGEPVERERGKSKEEKKRKRKKMEKPRYGTWIFGMETHLVYESYEIMHEFPCFDGYPLAQI